MNYHQGDIILEPIDRIPADAKFIRKNVVAYGEATGHTHTIDKSRIYGRENQSFVRVVEDNPMVHDTHPSTPIIPARDYVVKQQHEYFPDGSRQVKD